MIVDIHNPEFDPEKFVQDFANHLISIGWFGHPGINYHFNRDQLESYLVNDPWPPTEEISINTYILLELLMEIGLISEKFYGTIPLYSFTKIWLESVNDRKILHRK